MQKQVQLDKPKLCLVTPSLHLGGMERVMSLIANYAAAKNYSVYVICLIEKKIDYQLNSSIEVIGTDFEYKKGLQNKISTFIFLYKTLKQINPDTVLCFSEVFNPLCVMAAKLASVPVFISDRSNPNKPLRESIMWLRRMTYPFANGIVAQTDLAKAISLNKKYNKNIIVIPNPLRQIDDTHPKLYYKKIISVGRLIKTKKFDRLIEIFGSIDSRDGWELMILGDGPERSNLEKKIEELKLSKNVKLIGAVQDVDYYFSQSSIFAFTSISEGFPNALSEAMAFPLACIAYDCPVGPADIIKNDVNGYLIPVGDEKEFKTKLQQLMDSESTRIKFRERANKNRQLFLDDKILEAYLNFIH